MMGLRLMADPRAGCADVAGTAIVDDTVATDVRTPTLDC